MLTTLRGKKGQAITAEYVFLITLVLAALGTITVYVKRTLQGRVRDADMSMMWNVANKLGNDIQVEYEPYYVSTKSVRDETSYDSVSTGELYQRFFGLTGRTTGLSNQLPPKDAH